MQQRFESFMSGITACYKYVQRIKIGEMTELGLKGAHAMCLYFLKNSQDGLTAGELCRLCNEDKAAISRSLATLREKGYIDGIGKAAYRIRWKLTDEGQRVAQHVDTLVEQWVACCGEGITDEERDTFYRVLECISAHLRENCESE